MKRFSAYFLASILVITSYILIDYQLGQRIYRENYQTEFSILVSNLPDEALLAKAYLASVDSSEKLEELLKSRVKTMSIDFWMLYHRDKLYKTNLSDLQAVSLDIRAEDLQSQNQLRMVNGANHAFYVSDVGNNFTLIVGKAYDLDGYISRLNSRRIREALVDILLAGFAAAAIFAYFFRDIVKAVALISRQGRRNFRNLSVHSKEAELVVRGFSAYEDRTHELEAENDLLSWQVLPALRTELQSGKEPPYDFKCTMVRTDINNFSKIYNEFPLAPFMATINDFFTDVTHVVSRYGGLVHEFVGDEVIYYFKDEDVGNSVATAVSAIRDINEIAAHYNRRTVKERGYPFTVKSSIAEGSIQFRRFVNGFNLAGAVLIETVRILSHVHDKVDSSVVFNTRHVAKLDGVIQTLPFAKVHLKGYSEEQELVAYDGHRDLDQLLHALNDNNVGLLRYYRSDADIVKILHWLSVAGMKGRYVLAQKVLAVLRAIHVTRADFAVPIVLAEWLENLLNRLERVEEADTQKHLQLLSSAIRLIENLIPKSQFDERLEAICRQAATTKNRRLIANALDVLTLMKSNAEPQFSKKLLEHEDNRVVANALVHEGSREITPLVLKRLRKMLSNREEKFVASALYALGEIAAHHKARDPIYYQTQVSMHTIIASLPTYIKESSEMIRKQAMMAAKKIGDEKILTDMKTQIRASGDERLAKEAAEYLGVEDDSIVTPAFPYRQSA